MLRICAIDPGISGAAAIFEVGDGPKPKTKTLDIFDLPVCGEDKHREIDVVTLQTRLFASGAEYAFLEAVHAMPSIPGRDGFRRSMGATSAFNFGRTLGLLKATLRLSNLEPRMVTPQAWKKRFGLRGSDKEQSRQMALKLMPDAAKYLTRKMDSDRAESLLLAMYGAEIILGELRLRSMREASDGTVKRSATA